MVEESMRQGSRLGASGPLWKERDATMRSRHNSIGTIRPVRHFCWLVALVAFCDSLLAADRLPEDPVEQFRQALQIENNKNLRYKTNLEDDPAGLKHALEFRKDN